MKVLVTGGCGYIGSHTIVDLLDNGFEVVSVDNLVNSSVGSLDGVEAITDTRIQNYEVDLCDLTATKQIFEDSCVGSVSAGARRAVRKFRNVFSQGS